MVSTKFPFSAWLTHRGPTLLQLVSMLAVAAGVGFWGALLLAPRPSAAPPALTLGEAPGQDLSPVANWFGSGTARLRVSVVGLIAAGDRGAALLSINGEPAKAYRVGQTLAQGVTLAGVSANGVSLDQDGIIEQVSIPAPVVVPQGFVPVKPR